MASGKAGALEAVDDRRHGSGRKADVFGQSPGRRWTGDVEQIQALEISRVQADDLCHRITQQHRLGADLAQCLIELLEQVCTGS